MTRIILFFFLLLVQHVGTNPLLLRKLKAEHHTPRQNVLFLHSQPQGHPLSLVLEQAVLSALEQHLDLHVQREYLEGQRTFDQFIDTKFSEYLISKYASQPPKVIFCFGASAMSCLRRHPELFKDTPLVFCHDQDFQRSLWGHRSSTTIAVLNDHNPEAILEHLITYHSSAFHLTLVCGEGPNSKRLTKEIYQHSQNLGLRNVEITFTTQENWKQHTQGSTAKDAILFSAPLFDPIDHALVLKKLRQTSMSPIYGIYDELLHEGLIGGSMVSIKEQGSMAASVALDFLTASNEPIYALGQKVFVPEKRVMDHRQMRDFLLPTHLKDTSVEVRHLPTIHNDSIWPYTLYLLIILILHGMAYLALRSKSYQTKIDSLASLSIYTYHVASLLLLSIICLWSYLSPTSSIVSPFELSSLFLVFTSLLSSNLFLSTTLKRRFKRAHEHALKTLVHWHQTDSNTQKQSSQFFELESIREKAHLLLNEQQEQINLLSKKHAFLESEHQKLLDTHQTFKSEVRTHIEHILNLGQQINSREPKQQLEQKLDVIQNQCINLIKAIRELSVDISNEKDQMTLEQLTERSHHRS